FGWRSAFRAAINPFLSSRASQRVRENRIYGRTVEQTPPKSSREAAACDSPARKCRVVWEGRASPPRDDTSFQARSSALRYLDFILTAFLISSFPARRYTSHPASPASPHHNPRRAPTSTSRPVRDPNRNATRGNTSR